MALLNEAIAPGVLTHIADHDVISRVVNERHGVNVINPVAGQHYAPDMALGETHVVNLPAAGVVTLDAPVSTDPVRAWLPGAELVIVLVSPAGSTASVAWAAAYAAGGAPVPQAGTSVVGRWRNITVDANPAVWVPAAAPSGAFAGDLRAMALSSTDVALVAKGFAGQSADIQQWQNSAGTALARVDNAGNVVSTQSLVAGAVQAPSFTGPQISMGSTGITMVNRTAVANVVAAFKGMAGQTGDLTQWQDSTGAVVAAVRSTGSLWVVSPTNPSVVVGNVPNLANGFAFVGHVTTAGTWFTDTAVNEGVVSANLATGKRMRLGKSSGPAGLTPLSLSDEAAQVVAMFKGQASQSGDLTRWQNSAAATLARVSSDGSLSTGAGAEANGSQLAAYISNSARAGLVVRAAASQTADLGDWQNSAGTNVARIDPNGTVWAIGGSAFGQAALVGGSATNAGYVAWFGPNGNRLGYMGNNGNATTGDQGTISLNTGTFLMAATAAALVASIIRGQPSQTGDLTQWQNSAGASIASIDSAGAIHSGQGLFNGGTGGWVLAPSTTSPANFFPTGAAGNVGAYVRGAASQTADLQQWQNSAGTAVARQLPNGAGVFGANGQTIPAAPRLTVLGTGATPVGGTASTEIIRMWSANTNVAIGMGALGAAPWDAWIQAFDASTAGSYYPLRLQPLGGTVFMGGAGSAAGTVKAVAQGATSQTANLHEWQNSAATVVARVDANGVITGRQVNAGGVSPGDLPLLVKAAASQSFDLQQWQDSSGAVEAAMTNLGAMLLGGITSGYVNSIGGGASISMRPLGGDTARSGIIFRAMAGQTGPAIEIQNSAGTAVGSISGGGGITTPTISCGTPLGTGTLNTWARNGAEVSLVARTAGADVAQFQNNAGSILSWINSGGTYTTSSELFKRDIRGLDYGLDAIRQLQPVRFRWRDAPGFGAGDDMGFIAEHVASVIPEAVASPTGFPDHLGLNYVALIPAAIRAIQQLADRVDAMAAA